MAGGSWTTKHIVLDLPAAQREAYEQFYRSPCMVANVALRNWRFLYKLGISGGYWFEGMGCFAAIRKQPTFATPVKTISPDSPVVLTVKVLFCHPGLPMQEQGDRGRAEILATPFQDYELKLREQLTEMFGPSGFDARRDVAGIILNRWGHAYGSPQPGFFFGKERPPPAIYCGTRPSGGWRLPIPIFPAIPATRPPSPRRNARRGSFWTARSPRESGAVPYDGVVFFRRERPKSDLCRAHGNPPARRLRHKSSPSGNGAGLARPAWWNYAQSDGMVTPHRPRCDWRPVALQCRGTGLKPGSRRSGDLAWQG
jgi:hypothetical protein